MLAPAGLVFIIYSSIRAFAGEFETIPADIVLKSIGFKSVGIPGVAFDGRRGVVPNQAGQVGGWAGGLRQAAQRSGRSWIAKWSCVSQPALDDGQQPCSEGAATSIKRKLCACVPHQIASCHAFFAGVHGGGQQL